LTAVTTGYGVGMVTLLDGTTQQVAYRRTSVLIKQGGQWKEVHQHRSPAAADEPDALIELVVKISQRGMQ